MNVIFLYIIVIFCAGVVLAPLFFLTLAVEEIYSWNHPKKVKTAKNKVAKHFDNGDMFMDDWQGNRVEYSNKICCDCHIKITPETGYCEGMCYNCADR